MNRELPILFNTEMVRAILEGRKTVTRRVMKNIIPFDEKGTYFNVLERGEWQGPIIKEWIVQYHSKYKVGDIMYVRETWQDDRIYTHDSTPGKYFYKADGDVDCYKWRPSIHMPKEAARIWLKVTDVRVERLQDITEEQAYMEGTDPWDEACYANNGWHPTLADPDSGGNPNIIDGFHELWNSTIKKSERDLYGFDANPWVFVYEFERIEHEQ